MNEISEDWWLRSPGSDQKAAALVESDSSLIEDLGAGVVCGAYVDYNLGVRPVLNLEY